MHLSKYHGLGNDFLVIVNGDVPPDATDLARRICHRTRGVGADGLVFATGVDEKPDGSVASTFTLFNSDGSSAEVSGNGLRCFAHALARALGRRELVLTVATAAGTREARVELDETGTEARAVVGMGEVRTLMLSDHQRSRVAGLVDRLIPGAIRWEAAEVGNPHLVVEVDDVAGVDLAVAGPGLESEFMADRGGINVHVITPRGDGSGIDMRVWERGSGITEACGSGACAAGVIASRWGVVRSPVEVEMPGGSARVSFDEAGVTLAGPSTFVADIEVRS